MGLPLNKKIDNNYPGLDDLPDFLTKTYALLVELKAWAATLAAKLNADTGVADTNYDTTISNSAPDNPDA